MPKILIILIRLFLYYMKRYEEKTSPLTAVERQYDGDLILDVGGSTRIGEP